MKAMVAAYDTDLKANARPSWKAAKTQTPGGKNSKAGTQDK